MQKSSVIASMFILTASAIDAIITLLCFNNGIAVELNPIMNSIIDMPLLFIAVKQALTTLAIISILTLIKNHNILVFFCGYYSAILTYHALIILNYFFVQ